MSALTKTPGKLGFGNIRLNPNSNTGTIALLKENLQKILEQHRAQAKGNGPSAGKVATQVIDTANIFDNGESERAVGEVIRQMDIQEDLNYFFISKFGYFNKTVDGATGSTNVQHSGDADFMRSELTTSLKNLQKTSLDSFLIHEPEEQLRKEFPFQIDGEVPAPDASGGAPAQPRIIPPTCSPKQRDEFLYEYYKPCVAALEEEIHITRRIHSYGISTNTIGLPESHPHHVSPEVFMNLSNDVLKSHEAIPGNTLSGFQVIQTPFNVCETNSLKLINRALGQSVIDSMSGTRSNDLFVMALRPLTVVDDRSVWNLEGLVDHETFVNGAWSSIGELKDLNDVYEETLAYFTAPEPANPETPTQDEKDTAEACALLKSLLGDLKNEFPKFVTVDMYESNLQNSIIPMIHKTFDGMDDQSVEVIQRFFDKYGKAVRSMAPYHMQSYVESTIDPFGTSPHPDDGDDETDVQSTHSIPPGMKIEQYSLQWLLNEKCPINTILLDEINM